MSVQKRAALALFNVASSGDIYFRCMIPSNPDFGGSDPQLPKGQIDPGDTPRYTAVKEAVEEAGLRTENLKYVSHFKTYERMRIDVFIGEVHDPDAFGEPGWESSWSGWLNYDTSKDELRSIQRHIFDDIAQHLREERP